MTHLKNKEKTKTKSAKFFTKQLSASHKSFEVARSRGIPIAEILQYDLFPAYIVFDEDYTFKPDKAISVKKLEERLEPGDLRFSKASSTSTAMVVDFMSIIRRQPLQNMTVFEDIIKSAWLSVQNSCEFNNLNIVFDSYIEDSIKEGERRSRVNCEPLEVINKSLASKSSVQIDQFWASPANKIAIQKLCCIFLRDVVKSKHVKIVLSGTLNCDGTISPCFEYREDGTIQIREELNLFLKEADTRIIPHVYHNILNGYK